MRLPSLNALRAFEATARHLSIKKAASELNVTPAAVSQQVKSLEADLGVALFHRSNRGLAPTPAAESGLADMHDGFDRLARAVARLREAKEPRRLTVSIDPSFAATWLLPRLARFRRLHPDIDLLLHTSGDRVDLARGQVELAIRYGDGHEPGLAVAHLIDEQVFPVCSPALLDGAWPLRRPADLCRHTLIHLAWAPRTDIWPDWECWLRAAGAGGVDATRGPRFTDHALALEAAAMGQGVALGSTALVADRLADGRLAAPFEPCLGTRFAYYLVYRPDLAERPNVVRFRNWLLAEAGHGPSD